ncbi:hypothetical protein LTR62_007260 [Meristemomyces frigidus]|uniref:Zn(2)-C6 fungal-type domain-containing protein n=1 Tax=Meristemomyces frigidus TaxID=1508187 RepID=A0AAN7TCC9_9PEZI|nr:hypothetical protein LTR62_007260 [Meristemomyces frigidus]
MHVDLMNAAYTYAPPPNSVPSFAGMPPQGAPWYAGDEANYGFDDDGGEDGEGGADADEAEGREAKRRRIARACDKCRKKKIKCDGKMPKCSHCENYKTECIFTVVEKKRAAPKGAKYIEGLENRLRRMEHLLELSGHLAEDDGGRTDLGTLEKRLAERQSGGSQGSSPMVADGSPGVAATAGAQHQNVETNKRAANGTPRSNTLTPATQHTAVPPPAPATKAPTPPSATSQAPSQAPEAIQNDPFERPEKEVDVLADQMCSLITNNCGETRYIGSSSGFSIFSPKGIQWVNEKTGDSSFQSMIASATKDETQNGGGGWDHWKPEVFNDLFSRKIFKPLPPRREAEALLKDYFEHFNQMFPLFHEPTFMHLVDRHYSIEPYEGSGWWASLNVALAIAHRLRVMSNVVGQEEDDHAWGYLKNAMAVMTELTMRNTDLLSVQALLGMALFLQGTPNPQPSFFLVAAAIRLAHSIGLHKRGSGFGLNVVEDEQRKRVFWIAYLLDKDLCLRSGRPPSQDDDDMNVELPSEDPPDNVGTVPLALDPPDTAHDPLGNDNDNDNDGHLHKRKSMNLFRLMCTFAQIQSRVYKNLYSVRASRQSDGELLNTIGTLDSQLEAWKDSIPLAFRPEHPIQAAHTPLILHVVCLHFAYYNCLTTIHRMSVHHGYWTSRLHDYAIQGLNARPLNPRVFMSAALCVNAARTSIGLIRYIPQGDYACVWLILYYPVSALVTLFANILQNPQDARARSDLKLMSSVVAFLTMLERDVNEANGNVRRMLSVCAEFERIARVVLDKAERDLRSGRGKRKAGASVTAGNGGTAGSPAGNAPPPRMPTEREKAKSLRDRGEQEKVVDEALAEGLTLEQMQVETQAGYRRPVQTPSLRASVAASSVQSGSPASWMAGGSPREYRSPATAAELFARQQNVQNQQHSTGAGMVGNNGVGSHGQQQQWDTANLPPFLMTLQNGKNMPYASSPGPADFTQPQSQLTDGYGNPRASGLGPPTTHHGTDLVDPLLGDMGTMSSGPFDTQHYNPNGMNGSSGVGTGGGGMTGMPGSFQQPFVPQDLWQMPMTLEWDWAEGLGLGSFTPGPGMFDAGGYLGGGPDEGGNGGGGNGGR